MISLEPMDASKFIFDEGNGIPDGVAGLMRPFSLTSGFADLEDPNQFRRLYEESDD